MSVAEIKIDWASAEVEDEKLVVGLAGEVAKEWRAHFERTVRLLPHEEFGDVEAKKGKLKVSGVRPGLEEKVRFFLEGAVEQANAATAEDERRAEEAKRAEAGAGDDGDSQDAQQTAAFRAFAERRES